MRLTDRTFGLALPAAGSFFLTGVLIRGPFASPSLGAGPFAMRSTSAFYGVAYLLITAAAALSVLGYVALAERLGTRLSRIAMTLSIGGMVFLVPLFGVSGIAFPALGRALAAGDPGALAIAQSAFEGRSVMILLGLTAVLGWTGHVLLAVAAWRSSFIPRLAVPPLAVSTILMCVPTVYPIEIAGCALFLVAGGLCALAILRQPA